VVVVNLHRQGRITMDGASPTLRELRERLLAVAEASRDDADPMRASVANLVVRADRDGPWLGVQLVLRVAADPSVRIDRLLFGVRPETGEEEGTMAVFLGYGADTTEPHPDPGAIEYHVRLRARGEPTGGGRDLFRLLRTRPDLKYAEIDAYGDVPVGTVLEYIDVAFRAGAARVSLTGAGIRADGDTIPRAPSSPPARVSVALVDKDVPAFADADPLPPVSRVAGFAGNAVVFRAAVRHLRPPQDWESWFSPPK
jgi:hypothetical protein